MFYCEAVNACFTLDTLGFSQNYIPHSPEIFGNICSHSTLMLSQMRIVVLYPQYHGGFQTDYKVYLMEFA